MFLKFERTGAQSPVFLLGTTDLAEFILAEGYYSETPIRKHDPLLRGEDTIHAPTDLPAGLYFVCTVDIAERLESPILFAKGA